MSATIGKNADTGMSTIKFDSTGRTVQFTPEESVDFDDKLRLIRAEGKLYHAIAGSEALDTLQLFGIAIEHDDLEGIVALWRETGKHIVNCAILNSQLEKVETPNPFGLYYINDDDVKEEDRLKAIKVSAGIKDFLNELTRGIAKLEITGEYSKLLSETAVEIKALYEEHVGVGERYTDERIVNYFEREIKQVLGEMDDKWLIENMVSDLYNEIH